MDSAIEDAGRTRGQCARTAYVVTVRGQVPPDIGVRVAAMHAEAARDVRVHETSPDVVKTSRPAVETTGANHTAPADRV